MPPSASDGGCRFASRTSRTCPITHHRRWSRFNECQRQRSRCCRHNRNSTDRGRATRAARRCVARERSEHGRSRLRIPAVARARRGGMGQRRGAHHRASAASTTSRMRRSLLRVHDGGLHGCEQLVRLGHASCAHAAACLPPFAWADEFKAVINERSRVALR
jgi:hypothetical protein